jgi:hypothetical protein
MALMITPMQISETAQGLVLSYPLWTAVAFVAGTLALIALAVFGRSRIRRRWPISLAIVFAAWGAVYSATYQAIVTDEAGSAYAFLRYDHTVRWEDAADIYLERQGSGDWHIVVIDRHRRAYAFDVAELTVEERDRVMGYMVDRMPESAFRRKPELLKRQAPHAARPASFGNDQQI